MVRATPATGYPSEAPLRPRMNYPNLVALIDSRISLLQKVRDTLVPPPVDVRRLIRPRPRTAGGRRTPAKAVRSLTTSPENSRAPAYPPKPVQVPFVMPRVRSSRSSIANPKAQTALGGSMPLGPVFVSAAAVREEAARRQGAHGRTPTGHQAANPHAEEILRRWIKDQRP